MTRPLRSPPPGVDLLTTGEAAAALGMGPRTIWDWLQRGWLTGIKTPGGHWRVHAASVWRARERTGISSNGGGS
jgi:excisionase family DNA binding protein